MANFTNYTEKTEPVDTDLALIYDTPAKVNKKFTFGNLWKWIAKKIVSEGISQLETTNKTIPGAINELNSNRLRSSENIASASDLAEDVLIKCEEGEIRLFTIQSTVSIDQGSPDGKGGFLLVYQSKSGREYGIIVLFSYANAIWMKTKSATWNEWKKIQLS
jgi:hypothetical protein